MAVQLFGYANLNEQMAIQEAASAGMKSMDQLIRAVSHRQQQHLDCREIADITVSKFRNAISVLNRTGHARFRRGPVQPQPPPPPAASDPVHPQISAAGFYQQQPLSLFSQPPPAARPVTLDFTNPGAALGKEAVGKDGFSLSTSGNSSSTFLSSITGEGSVSNGKGGSTSAFLGAPPAAAVSVGKPPLSGKRCREHDHSDYVSGKTSGSSRCHCKKRKSKVTRTIRVPAISSKVADIPADEYSWRKYGQKPIKGSPYPRGYYKCSSMRGCPARKHVERATDNPTMLIVTYEGEHRHTQGAMQGITSGGAQPAQLVVFESS